MTAQMSSGGSVLLAALLLLAASVQQAAAQQGRGIFKPMIVLVGDSITEFGFDDEDGWGLLMSKAYTRKADVISRGFGGYTSRMGMYVLDEFINSFGAGRIKLVTLGFGANDASLPNGASSFLHVPLDEYKANLAAMVQKLRKSGISNIMIITPPPVHEAVRTKKGGVPDKTLAITKQYADAAKGVAASLNVPHADAFTQIQKIKNWQTTAMDPDGVHLSPVGNKVVYDSVMYVINNALKPVSPGALPFHMPTYTAVNTKMPGATFEPLYKGGATPAPAAAGSAPAPAPAPVPAPAPIPAAAPKAAAKASFTPAAPAPGPAPTPAPAPATPAPAKAVAEKSPAAKAAAAPKANNQASLPEAASRVAAQRRPMNSGRR